MDSAFVKISDLSSENGVVIRCVDFAPGGKAVGIKLDNGRLPVPILWLYVTDVRGIPDAASDSFDRLRYLGFWRNLPVSVGYRSYRSISC